MVNILINSLAAPADPEAIVAIVFFGCATVVTLASILIVNIRKAVEARHKSNANPEEVNALRHEVAHLRDMMGDVMLQLEYQRNNSQPQELSERITPPEFKQRN